MNDYLIWAAFTLGAFLSGSVMYCSIVPKLLLNKDIAGNSNDGNPGAANVFSQCGPFFGMFCLFLDMMKGFVPVLLACLLLNTKNIMFAVLLAAPVLGHALAPLNHFHGGKCIATAFGEMLALFPFNKIGVILAAVYIAACLLIKHRSNRIRSIVAFTVFGLSACSVTFLTGDYSVGLGCLLISVIAVLKHTKYCNELNLNAVHYVKRG